MEYVVRTEQEIFDELSEVCRSPGYIHTIAWFCFRDNTIRYSEELKPEDIVKRVSSGSLIRTEIATLIGLCLKNELIETIPSPANMQGYIDKTVRLLSELHKSIMPPLGEIIDLQKIGNPDYNPMSDGRLLREAIFYGSESAYNFQYREFSLLKYKNDNEWLTLNKRYSVEDAYQVIYSIFKIQNHKINQFLGTLSKIHPDEWTALPCFKFTTKEVSDESRISFEKTQLVIDSFLHHLGMGDFNSLDDFNPSKAYPIIKLNNDEFLLFQHYTLLEAFYETPFFWFNDDNDYRDKAMSHRGLFTEEFSTSRLSAVFGKERVHQGVNIIDNQGTIVGEIDLLVIFANRAIVLQAKSKKLTIAARKGNDLSLQNDFKKAVQAAYDQAEQCAKFLLDSTYKLIDNDDNELSLRRNFIEIYPFCVVSDHYPALTFQAKQFLQFQTTETIKAPFIMDIFYLDAMAEMLASPLHFLSYVKRRTHYNDRLLTQELTALSFHLKSNLWLSDEMSMMHLSDDICADLDVAMLARREGTPGKKTPDGILTNYLGTHFDRFIRKIEASDNHAAVSLGFQLLQLSGESIKLLNDGLSSIINQSREDGRHHDFTLGLEGITGLTIHCNDIHESDAVDMLGRYCELRKYKERATEWYGVCITPTDGGIRFAIILENAWSESEELESASKHLADIQKIPGNRINFKTRMRDKAKAGRNDKCPCGSGKKYKKCCL